MAIAIDTLDIRYSFANSILNFHYLGSIYIQLINDKIIAKTANEVETYPLK